MSRTTLRLLAMVCVVASLSVFGNVLFLQGSTVDSMRLAPSNKAGSVNSISKLQLRVADRPMAGATGTDFMLDHPPRKLVLAVQRELHGRGYIARAPNGQLDVVTRAAILAYESEHGLALTAHASEDVLRSMLLGSAGASVASNHPVGPEARAIIRLVQGLLRRLGIDDVKKNGMLDARTHKAIAEFQRRSQLEPNGRITADLVVKLEREARRVDSH